MPHSPFFGKTAAGRCRNLSVEIGLIGARDAMLSALGGFFEHNARLPIGIYFGFYVAFRIFVKCLDSDEKRVSQSSGCGHRLRTQLPSIQITCFRYSTG